MVREVASHEALVHPEVRGLARLVRTLRGPAAGGLRLMLSMDPTGSRWRGAVLRRLSAAELKEAMGGRVWFPVDRAFAIESAATPASPWTITHFLNGFELIAEEDAAEAVANVPRAFACLSRSAPG